MNAVIGYPLTHSLSPSLQQKMLTLLNLPETECAKEAGEDLSLLVDKIKSQPYELVAVTAPYKEAIIKYLDEVEAVAKEINSVNTVLNRGGKLFGYNTDLTGIAYALRDVSLAGKKVLLLGAGGVAKTLAYYINKQGGQLLCHNRTLAKAEKIAKEFSGQTVLLSDLKAEAIEVIINATPLGTYPKVSESALPQKLLRSGQVVFDLVYNPYETKLLKMAKVVGAKTISGLEMFMAQGLKQISLWRNINLVGDDYVAELRDVLISKQNI